MNVLGICGSLRAASINAGVLRAARRLAPQGVALTIFDGMGLLPLFNPDLEADPPAAVLALRAAVADADALLFASPEYAHGVSGVIKNALDWLVSFEPLGGKPVAVFNAGARARHADLALRETLVTMDMVIVEAASGPLPHPGTHLDHDMLANAPLAAAIGRYLRALREHQASSAAATKSTKVRTLADKCLRLG